MARNPEDRRLAAAWWRHGVVSCPECGVLCWRYPDTSWDRDVYDVRRQDEDLLIEVLGLDQCLAQGVGVGNGSAHVCPPTRAALFDESFVRLEGGVACPV